MQHRILLAGAFLHLTISNLVWIARDSLPPFWDMAHHQSGALRILYAFRESGVAALWDVPSLTGSYPPLYHSIVAAFYAIFGISIDSAQLANIPATAILMGSTYLIGRHLMSPMGAAVGAVLVAYYPLLIWLSRVTLIDYWLTALVALALWLLLETDGFQNRRMTLLFGVVSGIGMLTKWTFAAFLVPPALLFLRRRWRKALLSVAVAIPIASYWYLSRASVLVGFLQINTAGGLAEGDPSRLSWQAVVWYLRALGGYQLFLPLFVAFLIGLIWLYVNFDPKWTPLVLCLVGAWLCLMTFQNKDPRYTVPLLPVVALITAGWISSRRAWIVPLLALLLFQHHLVSFGIRTLPEKVIIVRGVKQPLAYDWNLYTQTYFGLWGRPLWQDWKIAYVLDRVVAPNQQDPVRVGMIPDIPRFDSAAFEFYILARQDRVVVRRLNDLDTADIQNNDYILLSEGAQGYPGLISSEADRITGYVLDHPEAFEVIEWFPLPNGEIIRLYRVQSRT